jgi:hypothetical protein
LLLGRALAHHRLFWTYHHRCRQTREEYSARNIKARPLALSSERQRVRSTKLRCWADRGSTSFMVILVQHRSASPYLIYPQSWHSITAFTNPRSGSFGRVFERRWDCTSWHPDDLPRDCRILPSYPSKAIAWGSVTFFRQDLSSLCAEQWNLKRA